MTAHRMLQTIGGIFKDSWIRHQSTLALICLAVFEKRQLSVSATGRALRTASTPKHAIKRVDRWFRQPPFR